MKDRDKTIKMIFPDFSKMIRESTHASYVSQTILHNQDVILISRIIPMSYTLSDFNHYSIYLFIRDDKLFAIGDEEQCLATYELANPNIFEEVCIFINQWISEIDHSGHIVKR